MKNKDRQLSGDVVKIQQIPIVQKLLNVICKTTGMGFAAIARVTDERWITCSVQDDIDFGLRPGDELKVETTICHEIRTGRQLVVFDNADEDPLYKNHHTPLLYGIKSYISVPIIEMDGSFFGTLCAVDPRPHKLDTEETIGMFTLFAELISFHLQSVETIQKSSTDLEGERQKRNDLQKHIDNQDAEIEKRDEMLLHNVELLRESTEANSHKDASINMLNEEIRALAFISSHDLQEPLRKIQMFSNLLWEQKNGTINEKSLNYITKIRSAAARLQALIHDLLGYSVHNTKKNSFTRVDLDALVYDALDDLKDELLFANAQVDVDCKISVRVIPIQLRQVIFNLLSNSIKFQNPDVPLQVIISATLNTGEFFGVEGVKKDKLYCEIKVRDNGIGFNPKYNEKVFELFQRLNDNRLIEGTGIGLPIARKIVNNHGGIITAQGTEGKGALFIIYLPQESVLKPSA